VNNRPKITPAYGRYALALLTLINVVNYLERNAIFALFEPIKRDLGLTDAHLGWLASAYVLIFSLTALPVGILSDLRSRTAVTAAGVAIWSVFTSLGGLVRGFTQLLVTRAAVGLGGAAANAASTALVADYFTGKSRAAAMSIFTAGLALGGVTGILIAGQLEALYGWRVAFMALGLPGFALAALVARLRDPVRGAGRSTARRSASSGRACPSLSAWASAACWASYWTGSTGRIPRWTPPPSPSAPRLAWW
jgi:MFS family permease